MSHEHHWHIAATSSSQIALCGSDAAPCINVEAMKRNPHLVCCVACIKVMCDADVMLEAAWIAQQPVSDEGITDSDYLAELNAAYRKLFGRLESDATTQTPDPWPKPEAP